MIIYFGKIQLKLLIPILFPISLELRRIFRQKNKMNGLFKGFMNYLGLTICGIFYLIVIIKSKSTKKPQNTIIKKDEFTDNGSKKELAHENAIMQIENKQIQEKQKEKKKKKIKQLLFIILVSGLQLIAVGIKTIWGKDVNDKLKYNMQNLIQIFCLILFSVIFLDLSIFSHQIVSTIIISICLSTFFIESLIYNKVDISDVIIEIVYYICYQSFLCLSDIMGKKYLNTYFDNLYFFVFKIGIIGLIIILLFASISLFIDMDEKYHLFQIFSNIEIDIFLLDLLFSFLFELGLWLIIYYLTPCHYILYETIANFLEIILNNNDNKNYNKIQLISFYILYPILIFAVFIFNEIIILNFCGLNYNTKIEIMKREQLDKINKEDILYNNKEEDEEIRSCSSLNDIDKLY